MADSTLSANLPAPKTFAPSREDVLSTLGFFFGDPATPEKLKDYSEHNAMTYHFPDGAQRHLPTQYHVCDKRMFKKLTYDLLLLLLHRSLLRPEHVRIASLEPSPEPMHTYTQDPSGNEDFRAPS
jgi:hypothetical protein